MERIIQLKPKIVLGMTFVITFAVVNFGAQRQPASVIAIVGATVIDGTGSPPRPNTTVLVRGGRTAAVGTGVSIPARFAAAVKRAEFLLGSAACNSFNGAQQ